MFCSNFIKNMRTLSSMPALSAFVRWAGNSNFKLVNPHLSLAKIISSVIHRLFQIQKCVSLRKEYQRRMQLSSVKDLFLQKRVRSKMINHDTFILLHPMKLPLFFGIMNQKYFTKTLIDFRYILLQQTKPLKNEFVQYINCL